MEGGNYADGNRMPGLKYALLPVAVLCPALNVHAATDAERITALEEQLKQQSSIVQQQQRMLEDMAAKLKRLTAGEPGVAISALPAAAGQAT